MKKLFILPYKKGSVSVTALKDSLNIKSLKVEGSVFKPSANKIVINWGSSKEGDFQNGPHLNNPSGVRNAVNKARTFELFKEHDVSSVPFTSEKELAAEWLAEGSIVVSRNKLEAYGGEGIELVETLEGLKDAPIYTKYVPKSEEYRVHVFREEVFFVQRKARKAEVPDVEVNWKIRNLKGGFIFANKDIEVPKACKDVAVSAVKALGLDFGAVDIIWNKKKDVYMALEVNTAPGLEGTTLTKYTEVFKSLCEE